MIDQYLAGTITTDEEDDPGRDRPRVGVHRIEMLDASGQRLEHLRTSDPLTLRLHYEVSEPPVEPYFGVMIHSLDGIEARRARRRATRGYRSSR